MAMNAGTTVSRLERRAQRERIQRGRGDEVTQNATQRKVQAHDFNDDDAEAKAPERNVAFVEKRKKK